MPRADRGERFSLRVGVRRLNGCELWLGQISRRTGVGLFYDDDNRQRSAQVVRWELEHGELPTRTRVSSRCGTATCVRLEHLQLGRRRPAAPPAAPAGLPPVSVEQQPRLLVQSRDLRRESALLRSWAQREYQRARRLGLSSSQTSAATLRVAHAATRQQPRPGLPPQPTWSTDLGA